ncbi:MAG: helix-turn-helix domain-containing protein [Tepidisphaeraceae bacterium]
MSKRRKGIVDELRRAIARAEREGMTRSRIASVAGMPRSQLTRVATGETVPILHTAERIARAVGCKLVLVRVAK